MLRIFIGYDARQPISYNVLQFSILRRASVPVAIVPLNIDTLPIKRVGLTPFTFTRFLVPWLCGYDGHALFLDSDMLVLGDVKEIFDLADPHDAVQVVKNAKRFEWASAILWNCGHPANAAVTPEWIDDPANNPFRYPWLEGGGDSPEIGDLPTEWNHLVGYDKPRSDAKLVHYTMGVPAFDECRMCEYAEAWLQEHQVMNGAVPWPHLMGQSVHACHLADGRVLPWFHPEVKAAQEAAKLEQGA